MIILYIAESFAKDREEILKVRTQEDELMRNEKQDQIKHILKNFCGIEVTKVKFKRSKGKKKNMSVELTIAMPNDPYAYGITINKIETFCFAYPAKGKRRYKLNDIFEHGEESIKKINSLEKILKWR